MIYYIKIDRFGDYVEHSNRIYLSGDMYTVRVFTAKFGSPRAKYYAIVYQSDNHDLSYSSLRNFPFVYVCVSRPRSLKKIFAEVCDIIPLLEGLVRNNSDYISNVLLSSGNVLHVAINDNPKITTYIEGNCVCLGGHPTLRIFDSKSMWDRGTFLRNYPSLP